MILAAILVVLYFVIGFWLARIWPCYGVTIIAWPLILGAIILDLSIWGWFAEHLLPIVTILTLAALAWYLLK